jgi:hypothetical protein
MKNIAWWKWVLLVGICVIAGSMIVRDIGTSEAAYRHADAAVNYGILFVILSVMMAVVRWWKRRKQRTDLR